MNNVKFDKAKKSLYQSGDLFTNQADDIFMLVDMDEDWAVIDIEGGVSVRVHCEIGEVTKGLEYIGPCNIDITKK